MSVKQLARRTRTQRNPFLGIDVPNDIRTRGFVELSIEPDFLLMQMPIIKNGMRELTEGSDAPLFSDYVCSIDEMGWEHNSGLTRRTDDEQKWFFHNYECTRHDLRMRGAPVETYANFFNSLGALNARALHIAAMFARMFDDVMPRKAYADSFEFKVNSGCAVTRVLRYLPRNSEKADAKVHLDRSGITVHWWSSRAGLVVFGQDLQKHRIHETAHDRICVFPGKKFAGVTNGEYGPGAPHGVIDQERSHSDEDRFAIVTFVHPALSKAEVRTIKSMKLAFDDLEERCKL